MSTFLVFYGRTILETASPFVFGARGYSNDSKKSLANVILRERRNLRQLHESLHVLHAILPHIFLYICVFVS